MLCSVCQNLHPPTLATWKADQTALIWVDAGALARSTKSRDCHECLLLSSAIENWHPTWMDQADTWCALRLELVIDRPVQLKYRPYGANFSNDIQLFREPSTFGTKDLPRVIGTAPVIPSSSESADSISKVKAWYHQCEADHVLCRVDCSGPPPARLLDISHEDPKLLSTSNLPSMKYVALSYCWGDPIRDPVVKTSKSNYASRQAGIPFQGLPPALRDAVHLARELGFRYLWIDALCIIQDDLQDWVEEAANMCGIYTQAALTIVASRSTGTSDGSFGDQRYSHYKLVPYKNTHVAVRSNIARDYEINPIVLIGTSPDPISLRAWTLQEAVLSNRAVHFTSDELRWESSIKFDPEYYSYENYRIWRLDDFFPATSLEVAYDLWTSIWTFYTTRRLTKEGDRLVALSGLAQRFHTVLQKRLSFTDVYLAGLWKGALAEQLLWYVQPRHMSVRRGNKHDRPLIWRAPTWSWASIEAPVTQNRMMSRLQSSMQIIEATTELIGSDPLGGLKSASLRIHALMMHDVRLVRDAEETGTDGFSIVQYEGYNLRVDTSHLDDDHDAEADEYLANGKHSFSLFVVGYTPVSDFHQCILIVPSSRVSNSYQRIGLVRLGQHLREPTEHVWAIEGAPVEDFVLL